MLIVEDDRELAGMVAEFLATHGLGIAVSHNGLDAVERIRGERFDALVLDIGLPGLDGLEITRRLRSSHDPGLSGLYIIMLTARVEEADRIVGLEMGADDYVIKPFSPRELVARIRSAVRRLDAKPVAETQVLQSHDLRLDPTYRTVHLGEQIVDLTGTEFDLLHYFMQNPGRPFSRGDLLDVTQNDAMGDISGYERTIDVHVKNIRQKLGDSGRHSRFIETVHGVGYRFVP